MDILDKNAGNEEEIMHSNDDFDAVLKEALLTNPLMFP